MQWGSCGVNIVWMSKIRCVSNNNFHTSNESECSEEYAESMEFYYIQTPHAGTLITICRKISEQIFLRVTLQILLIVVLMVGLCLDN